MSYDMLCFMGVIIKLLSLGSTILRMQSYDVPQLGGFKPPT